ncbi:ABC transporter permease [Paraeggerthella hongkongensis]|uniref:ABC transporter permease n=1 Tax=Paraeggerthella hongkongensis TaxID=230658 RepID=A0A3N0B775_9ACTN|nr:ABC transporter permease [Paraeggerthella hongkongensis]RNL42952.1 ABC transporter permease [Paraeggerthella hongkongensis]
MKWIQIAKEAIGNVSRNKLRTALTMLGLIIGISSVIVLVGMSDGSNRQVAERMKALGGDVISAFLFETSLNYEDMGAMAQLPNVSKVAPAKSVSASVSVGSKHSNRATVEGSDEQYLSARNLELAAGRNLSSVDRENKSNVAVIGASVARDLFGTTDVLDRTIKVGGGEFTVVGVLKEQGASMGLNTGGVVVIPLPSAYALGADGKIESVYVRADSEDNVQQAKQSISQYLRTDKSVPPFSFVVNTQDEMLNAGGSINKTMTLLLAGVASISLLVAGIGVMNVMLVSVAERVREVGIKKALGARRGDILFQFLVEALLISLLGGLLGIALGVGFCKAAEFVSVPCVVSPSIVGVAFGASTFIGLVFGIFPAYRASKLRPIEALRQE